MRPERKSAARREGGNVEMNYRLSLFLFEISDHFNRSNRVTFVVLEMRMRTHVGWKGKELEVELDESDKTRFRERE